MPASRLKRILVIGARGFLGEKVANALEGRTNWEVWRGSRTHREGQWERVDITNPSLLAGLDRFDVIIDCAASSHASPDALIEHCLTSGGILIESTADPGIIGRIGARWHGIAASGTVLLGMGLFPGVSNLLARDLIRAAPGCCGLDLAVRLNPLSGAGRAVADLMTRLMATNAVWYSGGERQVTPPLRPGPRMEFADGPAQTLSIGLPEPEMLHWSTGIANIAGWLSPRPRPLRVPLALAGFVTRKASPGDFTLTSIEEATYTLRGRMLSRRATPVELHAEAWSLGRERRGTISLVVPDGMQATADALVAAAALLTEREGPLPGLILPDEAFDLQTILQAVRTLYIGRAPDPGWQLLSPAPGAS